MNKKYFSAAAIALVTAAAAGFALVLVRHALPMLTGANLGILSGESADPHWLTAWAWTWIIDRCSSDAPCYFAWNASVFAVVAAFFAFLVCRTRADAGTFLAAAVFAVSPLSVAVFLDPAGAESAVALLLFIALAADTAGAWNVPWIVRAVLPAALLAQDQTMLLPALTYTLLVALRAPKTLIAWLPLIATIVTGVIGGLLHAWSLSALAHVATDDLAGPPAILALGIVVFILTPAGLFAWRRRVFAASGFGGRNFAATALLAFACILSAMYSSTGDPSPYWLAAEAAFILAVLSAVSPASRTARSIVVAGAACLLALEILAAVRVGNNLPTVAIAQQSLDLKKTIDRVGRGVPLCLVADAAARTHVLASGAYLHRYITNKPRLQEAGTLQACLRDGNRQKYLVTVEQKRLTDWEGSGLSLAATVFAADRAQIGLADRPGVVSPDTHVNLPGGHGAFENFEPTPAGPAKTVTITSDFEYHFQCIVPGAGATLRFAAANPIHGGELVEFTLWAQQGSGPRRALFVRRYRGPAPGRLPDWHEYEIPLTGFHGCVSFTAGATAPTGQTTGAWVTILDPTVDR